MAAENIKNKELTKRKLIAAVGEILKAEGHQALGVNHIAKQAGVHKKLIYRYFGNVNYLIEAYVVENDYWLTFTNDLYKPMSEKPIQNTENFITEVLKNQFDYFVREREMQRLILWEICSNSPLMKSIHNAREATGQVMLEMTDEHFKDTNINFRAIAALLVGGIYYTVLHTRFNGGMFCDLDINTTVGQDAIRTAIDQVVGWAFARKV